VPTEAAGRVLVSRAALVEEGGAAAWFVHREGRVERRAVRLGQRPRQPSTRSSPACRTVSRSSTTGAKQLRDGQSVFA